MSKAPTDFEIVTRWSETVTRLEGISDELALLGYAEQGIQARLIVHTLKSNPPIESLGVVSKGRDERLEMVMGASPE